VLRGAHRCAEEQQRIFARLHYSYVEPFRRGKNATWPRAGLSGMSVSASLWPLERGAVGRARTLNLEEYMTARKDALLLLSTAVRSAEHFRISFTPRKRTAPAGKAKKKTDRLLAAVYGLLKDLMALISGAPELVRNTDITAELKSLAAAVDFNWIAQATAAIGACAERDAPQRPAPALTGRVCPLPWNDEPVKAATRPRPGERRHF